MGPAHTGTAPSTRAGEGAAETEYGCCAEATPSPENLPGPSGKGIADSVNVFPLFRVYILRLKNVLKYP